MQDYKFTYNFCIRRLRHDIRSQLNEAISPMMFNFMHVKVRFNLKTYGYHYTEVPLVKQPRQEKQRQSSGSNGSK